MTDFMEEVMRSRAFRENGNTNDIIFEPGKAYFAPSLKAKEKFGLSDPSDTTITEATLSNADTDIGRDFITASKMLYEFSKGESQQEQAAKFNTDPVPDMLFNPAKGRDLRPKSVKTFQENNVNKEPQTDQEFAQWGINHIGMLEYNLTQLSATAFDSRLQDNPQIATALFHAMNTYEKLPMFTKRGTARLIKGLATDPLTYLGVGTLGATVAKGLSKQALKSRLKSFIGPQALLIYEGMGYGAFDDYSRQQIAINANQQEGVDPVRLGTSTAIGGAGAAVLGEAGKQVGKVAKKVFNKQNETNENSNILDVSQEKGINVKSDLKSNLSYSDLIIDGKKTIETRNTNSLKPYVGKRVSIVKTGEGKENTKAIGSVIIGEPEIVGVEKFRQLKNEHLVPEGSEFDIKKEKYLYPLKQPIRFEKPFSVSKYGIVERKIIKND